MAYSDVSWAYKDPATIQKLNQMEENSVRTSDHIVFGCLLDLTGTSTINVGGGNVSLDGIWLSRTSNLTALTAETNSDWEEGTSQENTSGTAQSFYVVAFNDSGNSFNVKLRASAAAYTNTASGTSTGARLYDKTGTVWYRYLAVIRNSTAHATLTNESSLIG